MSNLVLTKCVEPPTHNDHLGEVVYNLDFIEDYFDPPVEERQTGSGAGTEFSPLLPTSAAQDEEKKPLMSPDDYAPLNHPLSLMVQFIFYIVLSCCC